MNALVDRMVEILSGEIGNIVARASIAMYLKQDGIDVDAVRIEHLPRLAEQLKPGLCVFVGASRAAILTEKIKDLKRG